MVRVCVLGNLLKKLLKEIAGDKIEWVDGKSSNYVDLLILNTVSGSICETVGLLNEKSRILVNADQKNIVRELCGCKGKLITYGFNGKACVTASSVTENQFQICIQRGIENVFGEMIEEQEFSAGMMGVKDVNDVLGAVCAALLLGMNVSEIREISSKSVLLE